MVLIIANILSFVGNFLFTAASLFKSKKKILLLQSSNYILAIIAEYLQAAFSGMVQEGVSLIRNVTLLFVKTKNKIVKLIIILICLAVAVSVGIFMNVKYNDNAWFGYLPIAGSIIYSTGVILAFMLNVDELNAELIIKIALFINSIVWATYGYFVELYPILIFNIITIVITIISFIRIIKDKKNIKKLEAEENEILKVKRENA